MKLFISLLVALVCTGVARAQDTTEFTVFLSGADVVPPSAIPVTGEGTFSLFGNELTYDILTPDLFFFRPQVFGPAEPGMNGPWLFNLRAVECETGVPGGPGGYCHFQGTTTISDGQVVEVTAGLWYAQITSSFFPELAIRGQILPVPEPSGLLLIGFGCGFALLFIGQHNTPRGARRQ